MIFEVEINEDAANDLVAIFQFILEGTGSPRLARDHVQRLQNQCNTLSHFPHRGLQRHDIRLGLRVLGVERRSVIAYVIEGHTIVVTNIFHAGQDFETLLRE